MSNPLERADAGGLAPATVAVAAGRPHQPGDPVNPPVVLTSIYRSEEDAPPGYAREGNPTWTAFEEALGSLEGGAAVAFASGIAAVDAALGGLPDGAVVVVPDDAYSGTHALVDHLAERGRLTPRAVDIADTERALAACDGADALWVESPTNPLMGVADIPALAEGAHARGCRVVVDATFTTPMRQRALDQGADVVVHSATKFLSGHSDVLLGSAVTRDVDHLAQLRAHRTRHGAVPGPMEAWLALRGLRTLGVRIERGEASARELARRLAAHSMVHRVRYPGLPDDPGYRRATEQLDGPGAMLSFEVADAGTADAVCAGVRVIAHATSLGGVETTLERRTRQRGQSHLPAGLVRVSVGCEDVEDLWTDLARALEAAAA
ncbi:PLP-dependent transferase [Egibacter rhizosphaerae]|uniref:homocysteine desulfhydrase n=1 Tax=Egibacter rhizosphaerae TaxID=1670831 RepID=A0A411YG07_9ACTN|nr:PLP-dependent transferase [Egibacter rhizosphaerae]QBI20160.1 PLP-dependent transferase [Egibacter rhizosphaerae]